MLSSDDMEEAIGRYVDHLRVRGLARKSIKAAVDRLGRWAQDLVGQGCLRPADISAEDLDHIVLQFRQEGFTQQSLKAYASAMRGFLRWLYERGETLLELSSSLKTPRSTHEELPPPPLSEAEVAALIEAIPRRNVQGLRNRAVVELLYGCALRLSEALDLSLSDIDLQRGTVLVHGKGDADRLLPLMGGARGAVQNYLALRRSLLRGPDLGHLFLDKGGNHLTCKAFREWLRIHAKRALGPNRRCHPHIFRHSIAVHLLRGGVDIRHVQELLSHADLDTTKIYLRMMSCDFKKAYSEAMPPLTWSVGHYT